MADPGYCWAREVEKCSELYEMKKVWSLDGNGGVDHNP